MRQSEPMIPGTVPSILLVMVAVLLLAAMAASALYGLGRALLVAL